METQWIPLVSAGIGGLAAIIVMLINQVMSHMRWKEELNRKGEDKYLEKRLEYLHDAIVEFFISANKSLELGRLAKDTQPRHYKDEFTALDTHIRKTIARTSPYLDNSTKEGLDNLYEILTAIRLMLNKEIEYTEGEISTHLYWLNEALYEFNEDLEKVMKGYYAKKESPWIRWIGILSVIINILLVVYIVFN